jgi:hypothetical protein
MNDGRQQKVNQNIAFGHEKIKIKIKIKIRLSLMISKEIKFVSNDVRI